MSVINGPLCQDKYVFMTGLEVIGDSFLPSGLMFYRQLIPASLHISGIAGTATGEMKY